ncbi:histone H1 [Elizabethkingia occulta]|uniref:histone H1 n=1 Tax=Elizabethkingia occulta TaxID=1867263 RepID=UPI00398C6CC1
MQELLEKITQEFEIFKIDSNLQVEKGNKAAGTRARKAALELSKLLKDFRKISIEESKK